MNAMISLSAYVKIPDGIVHRDLQGELVLLNLNTGVYFGLDHVGTRIWSLLQESRSLQQVLDALLQEYEVPATKGREDLLKLVAEMREKGLVEIHNGTAA
jgi:hypothetical protein